MNTFLLPLVTVKHGFISTFTVKTMLIVKKIKIKMS